MPLTSNIKKGNLVVRQEPKETTSLQKINAHFKDLPKRFEHIISAEKNPQAF